MESPDKKLEEEKINDNDYTSAFFDDDQLMQLRGTGSNDSQNDVNLLS